MVRYYASALTSGDRDALARGDENHNLKSWTSRDLVLYEEARRELIPTTMYVGPGRKVCVIPFVVVTDG